jgi:hypothetical protein
MSLLSILPAPTTPAQTQAASPPPAPRGTGTAGASHAHDAVDISDSTIFSVKEAFEENQYVIDKALPFGGDNTRQVTKNEMTILRFVVDAERQKNPDCNLRIYSDMESLTGELGKMPAGGHRRLILSTETRGSYLDGTISRDNYLNGAIYVDTRKDQKGALSIVALVPSTESVQMYNRLQMHYQESACGILGFDISAADSWDALAIIDDAVICHASASDAHVEAFTELHRHVPPNGVQTGDLKSLPETLGNFNNRQYRVETVSRLRNALMHAAKTALNDMAAKQAVSPQQRHAAAQ